MTMPEYDLEKAEKTYTNFENYLRSSINIFVSHPQKAIEESIKKWEAVLQAIKHLSTMASLGCGFCSYAKDNCKNCEVVDKCNEMNSNFQLYIDSAHDYLEYDLLPWFKKQPGYITS